MRMRAIMNRLLFGLRCASREMLIEIGSWSTAYELSVWSCVRLKLEGWNRRCPPSPHSPADFSDEG